MKITATDNSDGTSHTLDVNTVDGGFVVAGATNINGGAHTWSGLTEDDDTDSASNDYLSAASDIDRNRRNAAKFDIRDASA